MDTCTAFEWKSRRGVRKDGGTKRCKDRRSSATLIGHQVWVVGKDGEHNSFFVLDVKKQLWEQFIIQGVNHLILMNHSANLLHDGVYIFGAMIRLPGQFGQRQSKPNDIFLLDPVLKELTVVPTYGPKPPTNIRNGRIGRTAKVCEPLNALALFMEGVMVSGTRQLWLLNLLDWNWTSPRVKGKLPPYRTRHASCIVGTVLYIYSGEGMYLHSLFRDLFMVDLYGGDNLVWHKITLNGSVDHGILEPGMVSVGGGRILIFGGEIREAPNRKAGSRELIVMDVGNRLSRQANCYSVFYNDGSLTFPTNSKKYVSKGERPLPVTAPKLLLGHERVFVFGGSLGWYDRSDNGLDYSELLVA